MENNTVGSAARAHRNDDAMILQHMQAVADWGPVLNGLPEIPPQAPALLRCNTPPRAGRR
jgi:hypothetical protein